MATRSILNISFSKQILFPLSCEKILHAPISWSCTCFSKPCFSLLYLEHMAISPNSTWQNRVKNTDLKLHSTISQLRSCVTTKTLQGFYAQQQRFGDFCLSEGIFLLNDLLHAAELPSSQRHSLPLDFSRMFHNHIELSARCNVWNIHQHSVSHSINCSHHTISADIRNTQVGCFFSKESWFILEPWNHFFKLLKIDILPALVV